MWPIFLLWNSLWAKQIIDFNILIRHNHLFPPNLSVLLRKFLQSCWNRPLSCCPLEWPGLGMGGLKQQSPLCLYARLMFLSSLIAYILGSGPRARPFQIISVNSNCVIGVISVPIYQFISTIIKWVCWHHTSFGDWLLTTWVPKYIESSKWTALIL